MSGGPSAAPRSVSRPGSAPGRRAARLALAILALAAVVVMRWWTHPPNAASDVRARSRAFASLARAPAPELGPRFERWRIVDAAGDTTSGLWRPAASAPGGSDSSGAAWTVVILGGVGTDDRAALLVPDSLPVSVLAMSWPWKGPRRMGRLEFLTKLPALREALLRTPVCMAAGVAAVRHASPGSRVALLGASLGVPPTAAALAMARPDAMVLVDGAAALDVLLRSEVRREAGGVAGAALAPAAGSLGARLLASLEPERHGAAARELPVLLIGAEHDERYPRECVERLRRTYPHATLAIHPGGHLRPEHRDEVEAIVGAAWRWLAYLKV